MKLKELIESEFQNQIHAFVDCKYFQQLENGPASGEDYDYLIANVCRSHLKSPQILAFLFSIAPPGIANEKMKSNLLEELGLDGSGKISHPQLLRELSIAAGFNEAVRAKIEMLAGEEQKKVLSNPILFGNLKELGLSILLETTSFEWMLSRVSKRMADFLSRHKNILRKDLEWFHLHSEVDLKHAEEGLETIVEYVNYYEIDNLTLEVILDVTFRENVFIKRYFGEFV